MHGLKLLHIFVNSNQQQNESRLLNHCLFAFKEVKGTEMVQGVCVCDMCIYQSERALSERSPS